MRRTLAILGILAALISLGCGSSEIQGKWRMSVMLEDGQGGDALLDLKRAGSRVSGTYYGVAGVHPVEGSFDGSRADFHFTVEGVTVAYQAVVSRDRMEGSADYGPYGKGKFTGVLQQPGDRQRIAAELKAQMEARGLVAESE